MGISIAVGVIFTLSWLVTPFAKPDPVLLIDELVEIDDHDPAQVPEDELTEVNN